MTKKELEKEINRLKADNLRLWQMLQDALEVKVSDPPLKIIPEYPEYPFEPHRPKWCPQPWSDPPFTSPKIYCIGHNIDAF